MAREWFTESTTQGLNAEDRKIMNRATRYLADQGNPATWSLLSAVRTAYVPGMSAQDVIDAVNDAHFLNLR